MYNDSFVGTQKEEAWQLFNPVQAERQICLPSILPFLSSSPDAVLQQLQWQMVDERGSWEEWGNENRWGLKLKKRKGHGGQLGQQRGGGNLHIDLQRDRSMDRLFFPLHCASQNPCFLMPDVDQLCWNVEKCLQNHAWRKMKIGAIYNGCVGIFLKNILFNQIALLFANSLNVLYIIWVIFFYFYFFILNNLCADVARDSTTWMQRLMWNSTEKCSLYRNLMIEFNQAPL